MRAYHAVLKARFRLLLQYRAAALAGFSTQLFWGLIRVMIFDAFYRSSTAAQPLSQEQIVTYLWLTQAMLLLLPWSIDSEIRAMVRDGGVAYELLRPTDLYWFWFSRNMAARTAPVLLRATPMFIVAGLFFGLQLPASWGAAAAWALATLGAVVLGCAIMNLMCISLMWTLSGDGTSRLIGALAYVLSGAVVPLPFLPDWAQRTVDLLPFRGLMDVPFRLYMGSYPPSRVGGLLIHQAIWTVALVLVGRWSLSRGLRRLVVQGG